MKKERDILEQIQAAAGELARQQGGQPGSGQAAARPADEAAVQQADDSSGARRGITLAQALAEPEKPPIGTDEVARAALVLQKYRQGKAALDRRIVDNELWFKMAHWKQYKNRLMDGKAQPASGWLFNSIANKHADAMDNYPEPTILPRAADDEATARQLSSVLPALLERCDYEQVYSDTWWYKLKQGTGVKGVFWDSTAYGGLGEIAIRKMDLLMLFWEPGVTDIQQSPHFFSLALMDNDELCARWPQMKGHTGRTVDVATYVHDDAVDTSDKSVVVDWYYKVLRGGRTVLHYCKFCNDVVLYASENDPALYDRGYYDHGRYPFVFDTLFVEEDTPAGFGYIDVMKDCQTAIDQMNHVMQENAILAAKPRYFLADNSGVNEDELADFSRDIVHFTGRLTEESFRQQSTKPMDAACLTYLNNRIAELKETSGNRDFSQGGTAAGVTAASAIAALQEAGTKLSRDMLKSAYRAFVRECYLCIELMRQFYTEPRMFRITGEGGGLAFASFSNAGLQPRAVDAAFGQQAGLRSPEFDIAVSAAKKSTFSRLSQNENATTLYKLGFFDPANAQQALTALELMEFDGIEKVRARVEQNAARRQLLETALAAQAAARPASADAGAGAMPAAARPVSPDTASRRAMAAAL